MTGRVRILLADDHAVLRNGLRALLEIEPEFSVVAEASNGLEAVRLAQEHQPDIALVDISMPGLNGIEIARQLHTCAPFTKTVILSAYGDQQYVRDAFQAGVCGYLLKRIEMRSLVASIRLVLAGEAVWDSACASAAFQHQPRKAGASASPERPREREIEVLRLAAGGHANKEIASVLGISQRTVQTHLLNVYRKLGVDNRASAVLVAVKQGWIGLDEVA